MQAGRAQRKSTVLRPGRTNAVIATRGSPFGTALRQRRQRARPVGADSMRYVDFRAKNVMSKAGCMQRWVARKQPEGMKKE